jgi:probable F420-dependent oxidoreductase
VRIAQAADRLGFAWISCSDHVAVPASYAGAMGPTWYDPVATLAYLAARTERIRLLSHVLVVPYRHPLIAAKMLATLDRLSGGRVIIGAGSGHLKPEFVSLGADYERRGAVTDEYLRALCVALEHDASSFAGAFVGWRDLMIAPRAQQAPRPPLWVGGNGPRAARRAATLGDGWIPWETTADTFRAYADDIRAQRVADRRPAPFEFVAPLHVARDVEPAALSAVLEPWRAAGATAVHVGFASNSVGHLIERMERFMDAASR